MTDEANRGGVARSAIGLVADNRGFPPREVVAMMRRLSLLPPPRPVAHYGVMAATACLLLASVTVPAALAGPAVAAPMSPAVPGAAAGTVVPTTPGAIVPVTPQRIADSRVGLQIDGAVSALGIARIQVTGQGGVPTINVSAAVLTVTAVFPQANGFITVWPSGLARTNTSSLNFQAGQTIASTTIMPVGTGAQSGQVDVFDGSAGAVDLVVDVTGYVVAGTPSAAGTFTAIEPARIADSRSGLGIPTAVAGSETATVQVAGRSAVPSSGVSAVALTVTAVDPQAGGFVTVWPSGGPVPATSNLNFPPGQNIADTVVVPLGADGAIQLFNGSSGAVDLVVDVTGYFTGGVPTDAGTLVPLDPARIADSRSGLQTEGAVPPLGTIGVQITGRGGVPAAGVSAAVVTVTVVNPQAGGYVTAWPSGQQRTSTSSLNFVAGQAIPNIVIVPVGPNGVIQLFNGSAGSVDLVVDVAGYIRSGAPAPVGTVAAWGYGWDGELGNGGQADSLLPVPVSGLTDVTSIAGDAVTAYAIRSDGTAWAWGDGFQGALGDGSTISSRTPVQVSGLTDVIAVAGGFDTGYAVRRDGTVWAWGAGWSGKLGDGGTDDSALPVPVSGLTGVTAVVGGTDNGYALRQDGTVWAWGAGDAGQLGDGGTTGSLVPVLVSGLTNITAIAGGNGTSYALRGDGTVWAWGRGSGGELGNGDVRSSPVPVPVQGLTDVAAIAGDDAGYALRGDGTVVAWGNGAYGALGNDGLASSLIPIPVSVLTGIVGLAAGASTGYALRDDGTVFAWGHGDVGQLGNGSSLSTLRPVAVVGLADVSAIAAATANGYAVVRAAHP